MDGGAVPISDSAKIRTVWEWDISPSAEIRTSFDYRLSLYYINSDLMRKIQNITGPLPKVSAWHNFTFNILLNKVPFVLLQGKIEICETLFLNADIKIFV